MGLMDPMVSLALAMHTNRGAYALLLGSGVSTAAGIPTGWKVVLDLIRKVAAASGEEVSEREAESWYRDKYGVEPGYTTLLAEVAKLRAERQKLLEGYFEGHEPSDAHHAIAALVRDGYVRVIVTTNFDRLMEDALVEVGVTPTVIASEDAFEGAHPIAHERCVVIKVHGDYRDSRIRNTTEEVTNYGRKQRLVLKRIFDEYGLVICGWSGDWDVALKNLLERRGGRRFHVWWSAFPGRGATATALAAHIRAEFIEGRNADQFFTDLRARVDALAAIDRPHPLTPAIAEAMAKEFVVEPKARIRLADLVNDEAQRALVAIESTLRRSRERPVTAESVREDFAAFEAALATLARVLMVGAFWDVDGNRPSLWVRPIARVHALTRWEGTSDQRVVARYAPALLAHCVGAAALAGGNFGLVKTLLIGERFEFVGGVCSGLEAAGFLNPTGVQSWRPLEAQWSARKWGREAMRSLVPEDAAFDDAWEAFELVLALLSGERDPHGQRPLGTHLTTDAPVDERFRRTWQTPLLFAGLFRERSYEHVDLLLRQYAQFSEGERTRLGRSGG